MQNRTITTLVTLSALALLGAQQASASINVPIVAASATFGFPDFLSANPVAVSFSDNIRMVVRGAPSGGGNSTVEAKFSGLNPILGTVTPGRITIVVEGQRAPGGNLSVALYNFQSDSFVTVPALTGFGANDSIRRSVMGTNVRRFINNVGSIRVRIRSTSGAQGHTVKFDHVRILVD